MFTPPFSHPCVRSSQTGWSRGDTGGFVGDRLVVQVSCPMDPAADDFDPEKMASLDTALLDYLRRYPQFKEVIFVE